MLKIIKPQELETSCSCQVEILQSAKETIEKDRQMNQKNTE